MNEKRVIVMDADHDFYYQNQPATKKEIRKLRVCAYARVSTDSEDQLNSYQAQIREFTQKINENDDWEFAGMYADEGISGTSIKKRKQFVKMIDDVRAGKIDLILTKSLSRFARNTVDCLTIIKEFRKINVTIFFEKENIYSNDPKVDMMLTVFSSVAQEESRNISENIKWSYKKKFSKGIVHINTERFLGYDKDENGKIILNKEEAKVIEMIFNMFLAGYSMGEIAAFLKKENIKNGRKVVHWTSASIKNILINEKYCGDAILQKTFTEDHLEHKSVPNTGQVPKYYVENSHQPIISRETFKLVQTLITKRHKTNKESKHSNKYPLSGIVYCGGCGKVMNRHYFNYRKPSQRIVLSCKNRYKDPHVCDNTPTDNDTLELAIKDSLKKINKESPEIINKALSIVESSLDSSNIDTKITSLEKKIKKVESELKTIINTDIEKMNEHPEFYKEIFSEKKKTLKELNAELKAEKELQANHFVRTQRMNGVRDFLKNYVSLNQYILHSFYKVIIAVKQNDVIFIISDKPISKEYLNKNKKIIETLKPIKRGAVSNKTKNITVQYRVVELGVKNGRRTNH